MITQNQLNILKIDIQKIVQLFVDKKFKLWLITHYYDSKYISYVSNKEICNKEICNINKIKNNINYEIAKLYNLDVDLNLESYIKHTCISYLEDIYNTDEIKLKYKKTLDLVNNSNTLIFKDSFYEKQTSINEILNNTFIFSEKYNIIIFGAGPCGLYIANLLKHHYKDKIEIVIIENRISKPHTKKIYSRKWLTNLPISIFKGDNNIKKILIDFGKENFIGCHINVFETLLYLSCRILGVKFLFENINIENLSYLKDLNVDLIFNATGNRLLK